MHRALAFAVCTCVLLAACVDLFHDTDFAFEERPDASTLAEAATPARDGAVPADFCALSVADGKALAIRSCALLSACQSPFGKNAAGACLSQALPAMACKAAPGNAVHGSVLAFYRCLAGAQNCGDVERCVFPGVAPQCGTAPQGFTKCGLAKDGQENVRIDCPKPDAAAIGEACAGSGKRCTVEGDVAGYCTGSGGLAGCTRTGCDGTNLRLCLDGGSAEAGRDDGFDCVHYGAGSCVDSDAGPACLPTSDVSCARSDAISCNVDNVAVGCPAGKQELADCAALFGSQCHPIAGRATTDAGESADAGKDAGDAGARTPRERVWDVQRACEITLDAGGCVEDTCSSKTLVACVRGARIAIDCAALLGTECVSVGTGEGFRQACRAPR